MKHVYYTYLLTILMSMAGAKVSAHDIEVANSEGKTIYYTYNTDGTSVSVTYQGTYSSSYPNEYTGDVVIPETITYGSKTYSVTSIGVSAFSNCSSLTSVTIPNSVTSIGASAFEGTAWYDNQPDGLVYAGNVAYEYKGTMPANTSITLKEGTVGIASHAFYDCDGLTSVTIPNSVTKIGSYAFQDCSGLTSVTIPNSVTSIGSDAFWGCSGLISIDIPSSVTSIGKRVFVKCLALTSIKVQIENTKYDSREDCNAIIETASNTLVVGCKSSVIPNNVTTIGEKAFDKCEGLTSIIIPNSVTSIESEAFNHCRNLTSLSIGENVKSIGENAFNQCSALTSVSIPNSVTTIGRHAFDEDANLNSIYSYIESPTSSTGSSFDISNYINATLYVPYGTKEKYLATDGWKNFTNIVEMSETALKKVSASNIDEAKFFSLDGKIISQPQKGLNILKMSDGTTRKIIK